MLLSIFIIIRICVSTDATETIANNVSNYCMLGCAQAYVVHGLCANPNKELIDNCPPNTKIISLHEYKDTILEQHNYLRNLLASGNGTDYPPASRMGEMLWDNELAEFAEYSARRCFISDPYCYTTPKYPDPGRSANVIQFPNSAELDYKDILQEQVSAWLGTGKEISAKMIANFPNNTKNSEDSFGRALMDSNTRIGCAASHYMRQRYTISFLLVCLYSNSVKVGKRLYKIGHGGSRCLTELSTNYSYLCGINEDYNISYINRQHKILTKTDRHATKKPTIEPGLGGLWTIVAK